MVWYYASSLMTTAISLNPLPTASGAASAAIPPAPASWWSHTWSLLRTAAVDAWSEMGGDRVTAAAAVAAQTLADRVHEHQIRITILGESTCLPLDPSRFEKAKAQIAALTTTDRLYPLQEILGVRKVVAPLAPPEPLAKAAPRAELLAQEKQLIDSISQTLTRIASLSVTHSIIGANLLSFEQLKAIAGSNSPYMTYLATLSWWRKAIAFLILYIFAIPTISLVLEGSSHQPGAIENIKNFLVTASRTPATWHRQVTNLFTYFDDTVYELREIALNFAARSKGETFDVFRHNELQARIKSHHYNHERILHQCVEWIIQVADVHSSIPLVGPLIDKIITSTLRRALIRGDIVGQALSYITNSPGQTHQNPVIYQLLESIASLLSDAHTRVQERRPPKPASIDAVHEIDFTEEELVNQRRAMSRISDLPYANAHSGEQVQALLRDHSSKKDDTSHPRWAAVLSSIEAVAQDGAALLLHLFENPSSYLEMRINLLKKLAGLITIPLEKTTTRAFVDVYARVGDRAMAVIKTAVSQRFDEKYIEATATNPYEYAAQLIAALKREITDVMDGLDLAAKEAFRIEAESHRASLDKVLTHVIRGLAVLNNRMATILERAPKLAPFNDSFGRRLADTILQIVGRLETAFLVVEGAINNLALFERSLNLANKLAMVGDVSAVNRGVFLSLTAEETKRLYEEATTVLQQEDNQKDIVAAATNTISERQAQLVKINDRHLLLINALEKLEHCQACENEADRYGSQATWTALWALQEAPAEQIIAALNAFPPIPEADKVRTARDAEARKNALYIFIESLRKRRALATATLQRELGYLKVRLACCDYQENHNLEITKGILTLRVEEAKRQIAAHEQEIGIARQTLCTIFAHFYASVRQKLALFSEDFKRRTATLERVAAEAKSTLDTLVVPKLDLNIEVTSVPTIPGLAGVLPSRESLYREVIPLAERQVTQAREFIHRSEVLKHIFQRCLASWFDY